MLYAVKNVPGCRENFLFELARHGLGRKDIVPNINFFCDVPVDANRMAPNVFVEGGSSPGDYVSLRAKMNALAVISNCPQLNNPLQQRYAYGHSSDCLSGALESVTASMVMTWLCHFRLHGLLALC